MPQEQKNTHRLPESEAGVPRPKRLPIIEVDSGRKSKHGDPIIEVLGRLADRTKERA